MTFKTNVFVLAGILQLATGVCRADYIQSLLGSAGPTNFTLLALGDSGVALNLNATVVEATGSAAGAVIGIVGSGSASTINLTTADNITGMTIDLGNLVTVSGSAHAGEGPVAVNSGSSINTLLNTAATTIGDASTGAVHTMDNLTPDYTYSWSQLATATLTPLHPGGINVLDITGNGSQTTGNIVLNDSGGTQWIVNIEGTSVSVGTGKHFHHVRLPG